MTDRGYSNSTSTHHVSLYLFFLILLRPPKSTLFPYTTLFRSPSELAQAVRVADVVVSTLPGGADTTTRSEEHTSELQSRGHLVCRLLLEKKKKKKKQYSQQ